ncbi:endonuclease domain-containing protein [Streptomyces sp. NPDC058257]|uniref:endonuclease domain-containing protein n=1 Tax=Streptomyces sp. NPDC058257 TaxID=3346409 RepID=UPI0036E3AF10
MGETREPRPQRQPPEPPEPPELRELAVGGVLLARRAMDAGWPRNKLFRRLTGEGWTRIPGGAWAEPGRVVDLSLCLRAGQLAIPGLVASHTAAASLWDIEVLRVEPEFTDLRRSRRRTGARTHWLALPPQDIAVRRELRVTTVARTLADLLRAGPRDEALVAVDSSLTWRTLGRTRRRPLIGTAAIASALDAPLPGAVRARRRLLLADPRAGSPAETMARLRMHDAGLHPSTQVELLTPNGRRCRPDFLFREEGVVVEIEGYAYHGSREAHRRDLARYNDLAACPEVRVVLRFGAEEVFRTPESFIAKIKSTLAPCR